MSIAYCQAQRWPDADQVISHIRSVVSTVDTTPLQATPLAVDFTSVVRPLTVVGQLKGVHRVPLLTRVVTGITGASAGFIGRGKPIPVSALQIGGDVLEYKKVGGLLVASDELLMSSSPQADLTLRDDLVAASAQGIDVAFLDSSNTGDDDTPAAVTSGVTPLTSSGATVDQIDTDLKAMLNQLINAGSTLTAATWILRPSSAVHLAGLRDTSGARAYPGVNVLGGFLLGLPVIVAGNLPPPGSPPSAQIVLIDGSQIVLGDEDQAQFAISRQATLQMADDPTNSAATGTATAMVSMFQASSWAARAIHYMNWRLRQPYVSVLSGVAY
ncbi:MAG: phage major capsid protein [Ramlibacter sp.]